MLNYVFTAKNGPGRQRGSTSGRSAGKRRGHTSRGRAGHQRCLLVTSCARGTACMAASPLAPGEKKPHGTDRPGQKGALGGPRRRTAAAAQKRPAPSGRKGAARDRFAGATKKEAAARYAGRPAARCGVDCATVAGGGPTTAFRPAPARPTRPHGHKRICLWLAVHAAVLSWSKRASGPTPAHPGGRTRQRWRLAQRIAEAKAAMDGRTTAQPLQRGVVAALQTAGEQGGARHGTGDGARHGTCDRTDLPDCPRYLAESLGGAHGHLCWPAAQGHGVKTVLHRPARKRAG